MWVAAPWGSYLGSLKLNAAPGIWSLPSKGKQHGSDHALLEGWLLCWCPCRAPSSVIFYNDLISSYLAFIGPCTLVVYVTQFILYLVNKHNWLHMCRFYHPWAPCQKRKIEGYACARNAGNFLPRHRELAIPTCITARAWRTCRDACRDR